jgi:hypothetical protein
METMQLINEYRQAYEMANGKPAPTVTYSRGWFRVGYPSSPQRRRDLMRARDVLLDRAAKNGPAISNGER